MSIIRFQRKMIEPSNRRDDNESEPSVSKNLRQSFVCKWLLFLRRVWQRNPAIFLSGLLITLGLLLFVVGIVIGSINRTEQQSTLPPLPPLSEPIITIGVNSPPQKTEETPENFAQATSEPTIEPDTEVKTYIIQEGDTIFSIAEKFNITPETVLWANIYELGDDIRAYTPGTSIFILPVDGVYHIWYAGDGLNGVASGYGVTPDAIIDFPGNHLDRNTLGNLSNPNILAGTRLIIPGGVRQETISYDGLLTESAQKKLASLPVGTPTTYKSPRKSIIAYTVEKGESIFTIGEKFGLKPETILWANRYIIGDTPDGIFEGQKLIILPDDGVYHAWSHGENLNIVAGYYGVTPDTILDEPLNDLKRDQLGNLTYPNIKPGTMLYVPGGKSQMVTWVSYVSAGVDGTGDHPNVSYLGDFACNTTAFAVGTGNWQFPTSEHWISGYEYNPPTHNGLDYAGREGFEIYAADTGVIIYSGWSSRGYGNTIVIDHGNGYLSLYAHLQDGGLIYSCGNNVEAGSLIGYMGNTGNSSGAHLHFEIRFNGSPVNPHNLGL